MEDDENNSKHEEDDSDDSATENIKKKERNNQKRVCDQCFQVCSSGFRLKMHKLSKHTRLRFSCDLCSYVTSTPEYLRTHRQKTHQMQKLMSCSHCQELGQLADLVSDWLFTLVQPIRGQLDC